MRSNGAGLEIVVPEIVVLETKYQCTGKVQGPFGVGVQDGIAGLSPQAPPSSPPAQPAWPQETR